MMMTVVAWFNFFFYLIPLVCLHHLAMKGQLMCRGNRAACCCPIEERKSVLGDEQLGNNTDHRWS